MDEQMQTLFESGPYLPEGFEYYPEFITHEEERILLGEIQSHTLHTFVFQGYEAKRKVASFGYDYSFDKRQLTRGQDIPPAFGWLLEKAARQLGAEKEQFTELLLTEYPPGAVINWHRDAPPFGQIAGISLMEDCTFRLRPYEKAKQGRKSIVSLPVKRRSLYSIKGPARDEWQHSITPVQSTRYSITLRTLRGKTG